MESRLYLAIDDAFVFRLLVTRGVRGASLNVDGHVAVELSVASLTSAGVPVLARKRDERGIFPRSAGHDTLEPLPSFLSFFSGRGTASSVSRARFLLVDPVSVVSSSRVGRRRIRTFTDLRMPQMGRR